MSDFFISQILVDLLLLFFLVRPFVKMTWGINGVPLFPLLACIVEAASICAFGFQIELVPTVVCCILIFFGSLPQLRRLFAQLPTDEYAVYGHVFYAIGIALVCASALVSYGIKPVLIPELALPRNIAKYQATFFETSTRQLKEKKTFQDIAKKTTVKCSIWVPDDYQGTPCPVVYYIPGPQADRHSREIAAGILAGNGYVVFAADFPRQEYALPVDGLMERIAGTTVARQFLMAHYCRNLSAAQITRNAEWVQHTLKETHTAATAILGGKTDASFTAQLPPLALAEPYIIVEQFHGQPLPDIAAAGISETGGIVRLCGPSVPAVIAVGTTLYLDVTTMNIQHDCINYSDVVMYCSEPSCLPFGEAAFNHPLYAAFLGVSKDEQQFLKEQVLAQKIRGYFDLRNARPIAVME